MVPKRHAPSLASAESRSAYNLLYFQFHTDVAYSDFYRHTGVAIRSTFGRICACRRDALFDSIADAAGYVAMIVRYVEDYDNDGENHDGDEDDNLAGRGRTKRK